MIDLPGGEVLEGQQPYEALYIHIPFCKSKCAYCDFASEAISADDPRIEAYIDELILSIRAASRADLLGDLKTVYIGGGTLPISVTSSSRACSMRSRSRCTLPLRWSARSR